jgi:starch synthase
LGILNGIDYNQFNPANDCQLSANYAIKNIAKRVTNKLALQDKAGFPINADSATEFSSEPGKPERD